ncbi:MAG: hypothetical protein DRZ79_03035, partial [Candidatus Cloacimonadota bacterium]
AAISQKPDVDFLTQEKNKIDGKEIPLTRWLTADSNEETQYTGIANIFAGGDFRRGPATAIEAIADGRKAAIAIERFLEGKPLFDPIKIFDSKKEKSLKDVDPKEFEQYEKIPRFQMPELKPEIRATNFKEVETGFEDEIAREEARRCLECGCQVNQTCDLRKYATEYQVNVDLFIGEKNKHPIDHTHPFILRDANKCIKCGRCVRICAEVQGPGVLGYIYRGFTSYVAPEFGESLTLTTCESCGKCIEVCPVGALVPKNENYKMNPHSTEVITQNCGLCETGCKIDVFVQTDKVTKIQPAEERGFNRRDLCFAGKFGWQMYENPERILAPYIKEENSWEQIEDCWEEVQNCEKVSNLIKENLAAAKTKKIYISPAVTNEEIAMMKQVAENIGAEIGSLSFIQTFVDKIPQENFKSYDDIQNAEAIVLIGKVSHTLKILARDQQRKGKKLILINNEDKDFNKFADELFNEESIEDTLDKIIESYYEPTEEEQPEDRPEKIELELPYKTLFIYAQENLSEKEIWNTWLLASLVCDFSEGSGVLPTSIFTNFKGMQKFGIKQTKPEISDFVILYGELPIEEQRKIIRNSKFIISVNTHLDKSDPAHIILPQVSYLEMEGTALSSNNEITYFHNPKKSFIWENLLNTFAQAKLLTKAQISPKYWQERAKSVITEKKTENKPMNDEQLLDFLYTIENVGYKVPVFHSIQKNLIAKLKHESHKNSH